MRSDPSTAAIMRFASFHSRSSPLSAATLFFVFLENVVAVVASGPLVAEWDPSERAARQPPEQLRPVRFIVAGETSSPRLELFVLSSVVAAVSATP